MRNRRAVNLGKNRWDFRPGVYLAGGDLMSLFSNLQTNVNRPTPPALPAGYHSSIPKGYAVPYQNDFGVAAQASVSFYWAFATFVSALYAKHNKEVSVTTTNDNDGVLLNCGFEDGWCPGWNQSLTDDLDWRINQGSTRTARTGPGVDHTLQSAEGHYAYVEASGVQFGMKALFRTPFVQMNTHPKYCLRFWYHMYGDGMGTLKVIWSPPKKVGNSNPSVFLIFTKSGSMSTNNTDWKLEEVDVVSPKKIKYFQPVYFEFQATKGHNPRSDIALDDISLVAGQCKDQLKVVSTTRTPSITAPDAEHTENAESSISLCNGKRYNKVKHACCSGVIRRILGSFECCGQNVYNPRQQGCCGSTVYWIGLKMCCGMRTYMPTYHNCCNDQLFNKKTHQCKTNGVLSRH